MTTCRPHPHQAATAPESAKRAHPRLAEIARQVTDAGLLDDTASRDSHWIVTVAHALRNTPDREGFDLSWLELKQGTDPSGPKLKNANLTGASLQNINLTGASLIYETWDWDTTWPDGSASPAPATEDEDEDEEGEA